MVGFSCMFSSPAWLGYSGENTVKKSQLGVHFALFCLHWKILFVFFIVVFDQSAQFSKFQLLLSAKEKISKPQGPKPSNITNIKRLLRFIFFLLSSSFSQTSEI